VLLAFKKEKKANQKHKQINTVHPNQLAKRGAIWFCTSQNHYLCHSEK